MELKIYYGTPHGVWVYIDGRKMTTEQATNELLTKGKIKVSRLDRDENRPAGLFSSDGNFFTVDNNEPEQPGEVPLLYGEKGYVAPIDYDTITPDDLKRNLESRIDELKDRLKKVPIDIKSFKESPPN